MPRPPRADEAGGLYHALNRGNLRATIFHNEKDFEPFERILYEALQIYKVELLSFQLMPNHYHLVLRPLVDGEMSRFMGWIWAQRGRPLGDEGWVESIARRLNLESTMRPRGRKRVRFPEGDIKEA